ncbi:ABC transporter substrate-binding protein [Bacillus sp. Marseille-P3661]|uniref:ABC transporter substrate-binding protein n=1 Tax=Bacillus sp. Marseille-P3661 TaxID=1936234 RepID=UPI001157A5FB|nr:ABC transporter substrate-binding protein [Bacillus sp. Marseille-P3661]
MENYRSKLKGKNMWLSIVLLVLLAALVACGNNSTSVDNESKPTETSQQSESSPADSEGEKQLEKTSIKLGLPLDTATFLPIYVASSEGFFQDEGLEVEVYAFKGDAGVVQALAGNSVDINAASLTGLVKSINSNQPFKAFWGGFNQSDFEWYSPSISSMEDAKGKIFGITSYGSLTDQLTRYAVKNAGLDPDKDVQILQAGGSSARIAAMESGQMDVSILATPFKFMAADQGMNLLLSEREDISATWPNHVIYGKEEFIQNNPETIKAFLRGIVSANEYIEQNPDGAAKVLMEKLQFEEKYAKLAVEDVSLGFDKKGGVEKEGLDLFWEISVEAGDVDSPWEDSKWLDTTFIDSQDEWVNQ